MDVNWNHETLPARDLHELPRATRRRHSSCFQDAPRGHESTTEFQQTAGAQPEFGVLRKFEECGRGMMPRSGCHRKPTKISETAPVGGHPSIPKIDPPTNNWPAAHDRSRPRPPDGPPQRDRHVRTSNNLIVRRQQLHLQWQLSGLKTEATPNPLLLKRHELESLRPEYRLPSRHRRQAERALSIVQNPTPGGGRTGRASLCGGRVHGPKGFELRAHVNAPGERELCGPCLQDGQRRQRHWAAISGSGHTN